MMLTSKRRMDRSNAKLTKHEKSGLTNLLRLTKVRQNQGVFTANPQDKRRRTRQVRSENLVSSGGKVVSGGFVCKKWKAIEKSALEC